MSKKIGHDYNRDPYPWDSAENLTKPAEWSCCDMRLSSKFSSCPICGKERKTENANLTFEDSGEL